MLLMPYARVVVISTMLVVKRDQQDVAVSNHYSGSSNSN